MPRASGERVGYALAGGSRLTNLRAGSELDRQAHVQAVHGQVVSPQRDRRPTRLDAGEGRAERRLLQLDVAVDLLAGPDDVGPVEEVVADVAQDAVEHADVDRGADFRHDGELVRDVGADVRGLGEDAAGGRLRDR